MSNPYQTTRSFLSLTITCGDVAKPFSQINIPFYEGNFHVYTFDCYYGDGTLQTAVGSVNSVISFPKGNLADIFFKNKTAGSNSVIVFAGTVPSYFVEKYTKY